MPLFHIHGLIAAMLASLGAGASLYARGGFDALRFFAWLDDARPTWYTAVPTMHQAIFARAARNPDSVAPRRLRFIRSSLGIAAAAGDGRAGGGFGCPVIEAYGMTEATHQMASNPLPPAPRKPGSVGLPPGPMVATIDEAGTRCRRASGRSGDLAAPT